MKADGETRFSTGLTHLREGRLELAIEEFKGAIKEDPKNAYFYKGLGIAYQQLADRCKDEGCRQGPLKEAIAASRKALELNPYYTDARNDLGAALLRSGQREAGRKELITAFNDPTNPSPELTARNLGTAFFEDKNYSEALNWFQSSLNRNKTYPDAWLGLADALVAQGRRRRGDRAAREGGEGVAPGLGSSCSPWARLTTAPAVSPRRGPGSKPWPAAIRPVRRDGAPPSSCATFPASRSCPTSLCSGAWSALSTGRSAPCSWMLRVRWSWRLATARSATG